MVEQQEERDAKEGTDSTTTNACLDLDDDLQDNLCRLWDMSMNQVKYSSSLPIIIIDCLSTGDMWRSRPCIKETVTTRAAKQSFIIHFGQVYNCEQVL